MARLLEWDRAHPGRAREARNRWKRQHRDQLRDYQRRWTEANREHVREYNRAQYWKHREERLARAKEQRQRSKQTEAA